MNTIRLGELKTVFDDLEIIFNQSANRFLPDRSFS